MQFKDKVVLITGGNSGIGKAAALQFSELGAKIMIADLAENLCDELKNKASYINVNVTNFSEVENLFAETIKQFGSLDILVNSAGVLGSRIRTDKYPIQDFDKLIDVNVKGTFYCMKVALAYFSSKKSGNIVNIASVAGHLGMIGHIAYSASKHAVLGMTKTAAIEFAKSGIRINAVCPGFTETPMLEGADADPNYLAALQAAVPMKRFGQPTEIADAILYLASDKSSFMTGQGLILDGGLILQ